MKPTTLVLIGYGRLLLAGGAPWRAAAQAPTTTALSPRRNAAAVARTSAVRLTFSQPIAPATAGNIKIFSAAYQGQRAAASTNGLAVTLTPTAASPAFLPGELLRVSVPATVRSTGGVAAAPQVYQFMAAVGGPGQAIFTAGTEVPTSNRANSVKVRLNQGPAVAPPTAGAPADTVAASSPAGLARLGCGALPTPLSVSSLCPVGTVYEWQYAAAAGAPWQPLPTANGQPTYPATRTGRYRVRIAHGDGVAVSAATEVRSELLQTVQIPNIFAPNNDQLNDAFELRLAAPRTFHLQVFNRWGRQVFSTQQYGDFWTGAGMPAGVYYYLWRYSTDCGPAGRTVRGTITLAQ